MSEEQENNKIPLQKQVETNKDNTQNQPIEGNVELQQLPQGQAQPNIHPQGAPFPVPHGFPQQPQQQPIQWMPAPTQALANCPPGLEYLTQVDQILVHQQVELWEVTTGYQTANRYIVKNTLGQQIYFAAEESTPFCRQCCGINRPFTLAILDNGNNEVIHMAREFTCSGPCFCCWCKQRMEVQSPPGQVVGYINQNCTFWDPVFSIQDAEDREVLTITGSMSALCCKPFGDIPFQVATPDGNNVGNVTKQWSGLAQELITTADNFGISFPMDLDVRMKAVLLGACFLIDFVFFERRNNQQGRHRRH